jgi:hypothetical protein
MPVNELATLAMLASTAADERPSGETAEAHVNRIITGLTKQLRDQNLATAGKWSLVWLARSPGNANLAFIAYNQQENAIAVSLRGTLFSVLADLMEDIEVGTVVPLEVNVNKTTKVVGVSAGAMEAFMEVMNAVSLSTGVQYPSSNLVTALQSLLKTAGSPPVVYVVGHSLGGAMCTVVGLYLQGLDWGAAPPSSFRVCSFAAPTAGVQSFADAFKEAFGGTGPNSAMQIVNTYDVVPQAWNNVPEVANWYPTPGPSAQKSGTAILYTQIAPMLLNGQKYVHPCEQTPCNLDAGGNPYYHYDKDFTRSTSQDFNAQVGYQHLSYLELLKAPPLESGPVVIGIDVTTGPTSGGTTVTISGIYFTDDCTVDFGTVAAQDVKYVSPIELKATTPAGFGLVNVTVMNKLGTSPTTPAFAFGGPEPLVVTSITPESGPQGSNLTLNGRGLAKVTSVVFTFPPFLGLGSPIPQEVTDLQVTDTQIQVKAPVPPKKAASVPMDVTVTVIVGDIDTQVGTFSYTK